MPNSTNDSLSQLEIACGVSENQAFLNILRNKANNDAEYIAYLSILGLGYKAIDKQIVDGKDTQKITPKFYKNFLGFLQKSGYYDIVKTQSPAGKANELEDIGQNGAFSRYVNNLINSPITGPAVNTPCLGADLLNQIHPDFVNNLENFCNVIRTRAYLAMPAGAFGSIGSLMWQITGAVGAFFNCLIWIYQGMELLIQQFFAIISSAMRMLQQLIISVLERYIPFDLICTILDTVQIVLDDIGFFASLFNGSDNLFNVLNAIQNVVNIMSTGIGFVYNPFGAVQYFFPKEVAAVMNLASQLQNLPQQLLSQVMTNFGFYSAANSEGLAIAAAIIQRYGLAAQLGPLAPYVNTLAAQAPNNSGWYRAGGSSAGATYGGPIYANPYTLTSPIDGSPLNVNLNDLLNGIRSIPQNFSSGQQNNP
jgi:hypothetical protein